MDFITILNSAPVGILLGIIVTKTFDILNKRVEFKQETKKILYTKKLEVAETSVQYLQSYYEQLYSINLTVRQALNNETMNRTFFEELWENSHANCRKVSNTATEMFHKSFLYFNIDIDKYHFVESNDDFYKNASDLINYVQSDKKENYNQILSRYNTSIEKLMKVQRDLIDLIIRESRVK